DTQPSYMRAHLDAKPNGQAVKYPERWSPVHSGLPCMRTCTGTRPERATSMASFSQRHMVGDIAALIDRSEALFPEVDVSTVALWLLATRAGRMTEAFTREVLA